MVWPPLHGAVAEGAALSRSGEDGKDVATRWYSHTLVACPERSGSYTERTDF